MPRAKSQPPKRGPGRPRIDPTGPQKPVSVMLTPGQRDYLLGRYDSISAGLRELVERDRIANEKAK